MKDKNLIVNFMRMMVIIFLYHITGNKNMFLYVLTFSLYNIFSSCFRYISIKDILSKNNDEDYRSKILQYNIFYIGIIWLIFILLSIFIGDMVSIYLNIKNTFWPYLVMSLSIVISPVKKILLEYLEVNGRYKLSNTLFYLYYILESFLLLTIGIICFKIIRVSDYIGVSLLYLSKIISFIIIFIIMFKKINIKFNVYKKDKFNMKFELKRIISRNNYKSLIELVKNSYYYISIIVLYVVLLSRYSYDVSILENDITFIYLYCLSIINFIVDVVLLFSKREVNIINKIYFSLKNILITSIIVGISSPLICRILFFSSNNSMYLMIMCILSIFLVLYNVTFGYVKNKKIIYISLIIGIILKILLIIPLINSFYRMGYNLIYGDITSTIIAMSVSVIINYIYIKLNNFKEKTLEKILKILYDSMILCIILTVIQFVVPMNTDSYIKSIFVLLLYITISIFYLRFRDKERKE